MPWPAVPPFAAPPPWARLPMTIVLVSDKVAPGFGERLCERQAAIRSAEQHRLQHRDGRKRKRPGVDAPLQRFIERQRHR